MSNPHSSEEIIEVGVIGRPHGVRGGLKVFLHNPASTLLGELGKLLIEVGGVRRTYELLDARSGPSAAIICLKGVESREQADLLKGGKLLVDRALLPAPAADEYYVHDLLGMEAFDNGERLGLVTGSRPQGDIEIVMVCGDSDELEVPLVDSFLVEIDFVRRRLELRDTVELPRNPLRSPRKRAATQAN